MALSSWCVSHSGQLDYLDIQIIDQMNISFTLMLMKENDSNCWFMIEKSIQAPGDWNVFQNAVQRDFIAQGSIHQSQDNRELERV